MTPLDTIRSLVSPHLTHVRSSLGTDGQRQDTSVMLSCLNDYFRTESLSAAGVSFANKKRTTRTTSEELFSQPIESCDDLQQTPPRLTSKSFNVELSPCNSTEGQGIDDLQSLMQWETEAHATAGLVSKKPGKL